MNYITFLIILIAIIVSIPIIGYINLSKNLDHRVTNHIELENKYSVPREKVFFTTKDNIKIAAWYIKAKNPKGTIILVHGYKESEGGKSLMLGHAEYLYENGYSLLIPDLRATGDSEGNKTTLGVAEWKDVEAGYNYLTTLEENKDKKIGCMGISMGAVTCINFMGNTNKGDYLIASVPYYNINSLLNFKLKDNAITYGFIKPFIPLISKMKFGFNYEISTPNNTVAKIETPKFFISAKKDQDINPLDTNKLYELAKEPKQIWNADTGHDVFKEDKTGFKKRILDFLNTIEFKK